MRPPTGCCGEETIVSRSKLESLRKNKSAGAGSPQHFTPRTSLVSKRGLEKPQRALICRLARALVQNKPAVLRVIEVKHVGQDAGAAIEGTLDTLAPDPVVLDKAQDGRLIGYSVVDEVVSRVRRDHQQGKARPVAAASLRVLRRGAGECRRSVTAGTVGESILRSG